MKSFWAIFSYVGLCTLMHADSNDYWQLDFESARAAAVLEDKLMLMYFTGSDWCQWCNKLDNELFGSEEFQRGIEAFAVGLVLDFPQRRAMSPKQERHNRRLKARMKVEAFPEIILYDPQQEEVLWRHSYVSVAPEEYLKVIEAWSARVRD